MRIPSVEICLNLGVIYKYYSRDIMSVADQATPMTPTTLTGALCQEWDHGLLRGFIPKLCEPWPIERIGAIGGTNVHQ